MIADLDRTLERLLRDRVPLRDVNVAFDVPNEAFQARMPRSELTVNLYLYDLRENHDLRSPDWRLEPRPDGGLARQPPRARIDLLYAVTAWSPADPPDVLVEHALLGEILRTLLRFPTLPPELLEGSLVGREPPVPTLVAQPDGMRNASEFWSALRMPPRPAIQLVVTIAVDPAVPSDRPQPLRPVVSRAIGVGHGAGRTVTMRVRPPLARGHEQGTHLHRVTITAEPAARLQGDVLAARTLVRLVAVRALPSHEWVLIDDPAGPEFVRLGEVQGTGEQEVAVTPPLRFGHDPTAAPIPLRRATAPQSDAVVTFLDEAAAGEADGVRVAERESLAAGDVVLLSDGDRTELVQVVTVPADTGAGTVQVRPPLRFGHPPGVNLFRRLLEEAPPDPAAATRLARPAAQPGSPIRLDRDVGPAGALLMVGAGPTVEFCRLESAATAGAPVAVGPALGSNQPAGAPLRRLTRAELVGRLQAAAPAGAEEVAMAGDPGAVQEAGRRRRPLVGAGEVLQVDDPARPAAFQVAAAAEVPGALRDAPEVFVAAGGEVTDSATPANPVPGARVTMREPQLLTTTDAAGRFLFTNLLPGSYTMEVTAPGYQDAERVVQVPARSVDEYRVALQP